MVKVGDPVILDYGGYCQKNGTVVSLSSEKNFIRVKTHTDEHTYMVHKVWDAFGVNLGEKKKELDNIIQLNREKDIKDTLLRKTIAANLYYLRMQLHITQAGLMKAIWVKLGEN